MYNKSLQTLFFLLLLTSAVIFSCQNNDGTTVAVDTQGLFEFPSEFDFSDNDEVPDYLDHEMILCNGKGLKVAKCISNQLKKGICLGIIKHEKRVYAVEIPCESVKSETTDTIIAEL